MVKTAPCNVGGEGLIPGWGSLPRAQKQNIKQIISYDFLELVLWIIYYIHKGCKNHKHIQVNYVTFQIYSFMRGGVQLWACK